MARIEVARDAIVVEGELVEEACEEFEQALDSLRWSKVTRPTVDLSHITAAATRPVGLLFAAWLDMFSQGRAPYLRAPPYIWRMLGQAAVDQGFLKKDAQGAPGVRPPSPRLRRAPSEALSAGRQASAKDGRIGRTG